MDIIFPMQVRPAQLKYLEGVVTCHMASLPEVEITRLGRDFLTRHHRFYITHPEGICLVCVEEKTGRVAGFILGARPELRRTFLVKHGLATLTAFASNALTDRHIRRRLIAPLRTLVLKLARRIGVVPASEVEPEPPHDPPGTWSYILFLGTHPDFRRRGVMRSLLEAFREECARRGFQSMHLSTRRDNDASTALYLRCGWTIIHQTKSMTYFRQLTR
ncbi:MAG: GNAT family N-acetyltransferase [Phycisphaerae bacterium]|nr:GNAT family N-acetyltransferase [Phycisphaerae bacterium]